MLLVVDAGPGGHWGHVPPEKNNVGQGVIRVEGSGFIYGLGSLSLGLRF